MSSPLVDRFGISIGTSYATQVWKYQSVYRESDNKYKFGVQAFLHAEKDLVNKLALRIECGYIQKGFKVDKPIVFESGSTEGSNKVVLHDLALNIGLKIAPFSFHYSPYFIIGLRGDYMISYEESGLEEPGS